MSPPTLSAHDDQETAAEMALADLAAEVEQAFIQYQPNKEPTQ